MTRIAGLVLGLSLLSTPVLAQAVTPPPVLAAAVDPAKIRAEGQAFLARNATAPGVITRASGLQYKVDKAAPTGAPSPKIGDIIKVHYEGRLLDGAVFDSSFARGQAVIMPADGLVPGWMEALPLMRVGDEWTLYVPPELGYGDQAGGPIPAGSVMIFRLRLIGMLAVD